MDPATIAMASVNLVVAYVSRHHDELVDRVGDAVVDRLGALYGWVRDHLRPEPNGGAALDNLEQAPDDARRQGAVEFALTQLLDQNTALMQELASLVDEVEEATPAGVRITQSGAVAVGGNVSLEGTYVAGRDLSIGQSAESAGSTIPPPVGSEPEPDSQ